METQSLPLTRLRLPCWLYGDHSALRAFFETYCKAFQHWEPADEAALRLTPTPSPKTSPKASLLTARGKAAVASPGPGPGPVRGCAAAHPQPVLRALVGAVEQVSTEFIQGVNPCFTHMTHQSVCSDAYICRLSCLCGKQTNPAFALGLAYWHTMLARTGGNKVAKYFASRGVLPMKAEACPSVAQ